MVGREAPREKGTDVYGEHETQRQHDGADHRVQHQVHTVQDTDALLGAPRPFQGVETDVRFRETEREKCEREDERVRGLVHTVVRLPHERQEHRRVDEVDEVLDDDVGVASSAPALRWLDTGNTIKRAL